MLRNFSRVFLALSVVLTVALVLGFGVAGVARAEADPRAALQQALAIVDQAQVSPEAARPARAKEAVDVLAREPDLASQRWLVEPLTATPPNLPVAKSRLAAALAALDPSARPAPEARPALDAVLADPRFHPTDWTHYLPAWLIPAALIAAKAIHLVQTIVQWPFDRLFEGLRAVFGSKLFAPTLAVLAILVALAVVVLYRRGLRAMLVAQAEAATPPDARPLTAASAFGFARDRADAGDYRQATHFVLLATLLELEARDATRFDRAATNREHLARLAARSDQADPGLAPRLAAIVDRFDRAWYGQDAVSREDYEELLHLARNVAVVTP